MNARKMTVLQGKVNGHSVSVLRDTSCMTVVIRRKLVADEQRTGEYRYSVLLHTITNMLLTNPYVTVISLDFSKAFDTVRHSTLLEKISLLDIPDHVYNWIVDFFREHSHCTAYRGQVSTEKTITASIVQVLEWGWRHMLLLPEISKSSTILII